MSRRHFLGASAAGAAVALGRSGLVASDDPPGPLKAGAATSNTTLPLGASNGGVIARGGPARYIHDEMHARCLVLDDGQTRVAFAVCDMRMIGRPIIERAKGLVHAATGLTPDQVLICATHTHGAPGVIGGNLSELDLWYHDFLARRIADGISKAASQLAPARLGWAVASRPEHLFNRRWQILGGGGD